MIQLANYEERTFYVVLGQIVTSCDVKFIFQMTEEEFDVTLTPVSSTERATKFAFTATGYPEGQYIVQFNVSGSTLATVAGFVTGNPIFATSQYNTYNDDGTSTTYVPSDDQGLVPSVSQKLRVSTVDLGTDVSYVRYLKVTNGTLTDNGDNSVTIDTSGVDTLEALTDVYIENLDNNQIIQYQSFSLPGNPAGWKNRVLQLASLSDTKGVPTEGKFLKYTGGFWQPADGSANSLNDLSDVTITSPNSGNILQYSSNFGWYNTNLPTPSPPPSTTDQLPEGTTNLYYTEARVSANTDVAANTAKVGITAQQAADILNNNAKVGITAQQASDITTNNAKVSLIAGGTTGQALVKTSGTDYDVEWADIAVDVQYHNRYATESETLRAGATATTELYYSAQADGDGLAESASSDTPTAGYDIRRKLYYSEAGFADPDTGTWTQFTAIADNTTYANAKAALLAYLKERTGGTVPISLKMTWEEVAQAPAFTGLLNESYGSGAEAAYSTRRLNGNITDCMVIRRASDSTTQTIGFDGSGNIDESAIETFCTGTTCTVVTWKDQSGNGNDATAAASGNEPTIYTGGALVKQDGRVGIDFDGSTDYLISTISSISQPFDFYSVFKYDTIVGGGTERLYWTQTILNRARNASAFDYMYAGAVLGGGNKSRELIRLQETHVYNGSSSAFRRSGTQMVSGNVGGLSTGTSLYIGSNNTGAADNCIEGILQEMILFDNSKSAGDRTSVEENQGDYFTQNTPLLDTYSGAAAAYSLRLLDSTYTGALVEVYNGSSYADIGANVFGELDTVALAAHCGSNDGFVSKWYDQSGNSNTAAQATTASMPKIYDGTTGVVTENGKPAVDNTNGGYFNLNSTITLTDFDIFSVVNTINSGSYYGYGTFIGNRATTNQMIYERVNNITLRSGGGDVQIAATNVNGQKLVNPLRTSNVTGYFQNSIDIGTNNTATGNFTVANILDGYPSGQIQASGNFQEIVIYNSDQSTNRTNIEDNINTFYSIY